MIKRRQLPVASPLGAGGLARGAVAMIARSPRLRQRLAAELAHRYNAPSVALVDSGTSALVAALKLVVGPHGTVAYPAYTCVDLIAAAHQAGVRVRLYDIDPHTLAPDLDSLSRVLSDGVTAVVVGHLYGYQADVNAVRIVASRFGEIPIIEDAAQHASAALHGTRMGSTGDLSVLSFGRGKGITGGSGGALLARHPRWREGVDALARQLPEPAAGLNVWIAAAASWVLGRPSIYAIPSAIPSLHLGETVYHDAHDPQALTHVAAAIVEQSLQHADHDAVRRRETARLLHDAAAQSTRVRACVPLSRDEAGYLRFPVVADPSIPPIPRLGIVRGYPRALVDQPELQSLLCPSPDPFYGARELATQLLTLPTHHMVHAGDLRQLTAWLRTT